MLSDSWAISGGFSRKKYGIGGGGGGDGGTEFIGEVGRLLRDVFFIREGTLSQSASLKETVAIKGVELSGFQESRCVESDQRKHAYVGSTIGQISH